MIKTKNPIWLAVLLLPSFVVAEDWTAEQLEVIESVKSCFVAPLEEEWLECYHEDYVGWYMERSFAYKKANKKADGDGWVWEGFAFELIEFTPIKVHVSGDLAVTLYSATLKMTNIETGESTVEEQVRWMDARVKEDGRWASIAEHGIKMPTD
jgi:ketosteroid isomerase-like protein